MSRKIDLQAVRRQAFGHWPDILAALGIPAEVLAKRRNQPCPACGGTDRFQFIDKAQGRFVCRALDGQGGDGFALVMHWLNADFPAALRAIAGVLGMAESTGQVLPTPAPPAPVKPPARDDSAKLRQMWGEAMPICPGDPVALYLANRGIGMAVYPAALRYHPALGLWAEVNGKPVKIGSYPALLAKVTSSTGEAVGLHRIYLTPDGHKAQPIHPTTGEALNAKRLITAREGVMRGAAVRLHEPEAGAVAVAEGIETALAVRIGSALPCWATVSAWGMENIILPEPVTDVYIMADNDLSGTGQKAAKTLAKRLMEEARRVRLIIPTAPGTDWLDVLNTRQEAAE